MQVDYLDTQRKKEAAKLFEKVSCLSSHGYGQVFEDGKALQADQCSSVDASCLPTIRKSGTYLILDPLCFH